jgi:serine/threonine-protein kinase
MSHTRTIAVLPFANLSPEADQAFFCDGITEDLISILSRVPELTVIGRTSVFAIKDLALDAREIGARLGAGTVVAGSVRKDGNRLRISAEIVDPETRKVRWADVFDRTLGDIFAIQEEIAATIAKILRVKLTADISKSLTRGAPDIAAYFLYLKGRQAWNRMTLEGFREAIGSFEYVISLFPGYAPPYAGLADTYCYLALWGGSRPRSAFAKAKEAAREALRIDPDLPHAYSSLAAATAFDDWRWAEGTELARRAVAMEPCYGFAHHVLGCCLLVRHALDEAAKCFERAVSLDPLSVRANRTLGWSLYLRRRPEEAEKWLQMAVAISPDAAETRYMLGKVQLYQQRPEAAAEEARRCQQRSDDPLIMGLMGACLARMGQKEEAERLLEKLVERSEREYVDPHAAGQIYIALGDVDRALESIRQSLDERTPLSTTFKLDPEFDELRSNPRFTELIDQMNG